MSVLWGEYEWDFQDFTYVILNETTYKNQQIVYMVILFYVFTVNLFRAALNCFNHCFYALTDEKQQIYKLTAWHRVPHCELVDLLFFGKKL